MVIVRATGAGPITIVRSFMLLAFIFVSFFLLLG
jgi:hypothetical protein